MKYQLKPFKKHYLQHAVQLFADCYKEARRANSLLPSMPVERPQWINDSLQRFLGNAGTSVWRGREMVGFMITGYHFKYKGQEAALIPEYAHATIREDKARLYQVMYGFLAAHWMKQSVHLHLVCHLAHDAVLKNILFELGFGAIVAEQIRDLSDIGVDAEYKVVKETDISRLIAIEKEHRLYYKESPIFVLKDTTMQSVKTSLERHIEEGDEIFVHYENGRACAYMIVGRVGETAEGFLLRKSNTAQIKSIYAKPQTRSQGMGKLLLRIAIGWAREHGYERLFAEHETANTLGVNFWNKYFTPMVYASMRYIDNRIASNVHRPCSIQQ